MLEYKAESRVYKARDRVTKNVLKDRLEWVFELRVSGDFE